jgi:hypothetical protein
MEIIHEIGGKGVSAILGLLVGGLGTWLFARWKRYRERQNILRGDARETIVIHQHLVEKADKPTADGSSTMKVPTTLRIRSLGQGELARVVPNGHLAAELLSRAFAVTPFETLISMEGAEGSYLLETLTNFVCDRVANAPFEHDLFVMAPCCEPAALAEHQPITVIVIAAKDLELFESWPVCREIKVERGMEGARILTLMEMARRFRAEQAKIFELRRSGQRTRFIETMYVLDLSLDKRTAFIPVKEIPWNRFEEVLKKKNLE